MWRERRKKAEAGKDGFEKGGGCSEPKAKGRKYSVPWSCRSVFESPPQRTYEGETGDGMVPISSSCGILPHLQRDTAFRRHLPSRLVSCNLSLISMPTAGA